MMIEILAYAVIGLYTLALAYVTLYCLMQFHLLLHYFRNKKATISPTSDRPFLPNEWPAVTVQLPLYNERYVVERLLENIVQLDYPSDKLEIQILDDSTDETQEVCQRMVRLYKEQGIHITYLHRHHRQGYKAGALKNGLSSATGDFIAIFDADFLPPKTFLTQTIPYFSDPQVGVVQTRWEHLNYDYSLITRLQGFQLNVHFTIEQSGRQAGKYFLQFNGTAGVWRRETIQDAGGWESDTLTEDLDLSYRAQLRGWKIMYRQDIASPAELPAEMHGLKSQQFRWMKGGAENARKLIPIVLASRLPWSTKVQAVLHLLSSSIFIVVFMLAILSVPALLMNNLVDLDMRIYWLCMTGMLTIGWVYFVANSDTAWVGLSFRQRLLRFTTMFPLFLSLSMGLSLHNSIAVLEGYRGKPSAFVRTPKFNLRRIQDQIKPGVYAAGKLSFTTLAEGVLALYFLSAIVFALSSGKTEFVLYHFMLMFGFGGIFFYSIRHLHVK